MVMLQTYNIIHNIQGMQGGGGRWDISTGDNSYSLTHLTSSSPTHPRKHFFIRPRLLRLSTAFMYLACFDSRLFHSFVALTLGGH